ncbi:MAG: hypothetical protein MJE63_24645 [Proteobacteria bacterium]|nr:hypothetical protein [Pseudomonadota bacterium]
MILEQIVESAISVLFGGSLQSIAFVTFNPENEIAFFKETLRLERIRFDCLSTRRDFDKYSESWVNLKKSLNNLIIKREFEHGSVDVMNIDWSIEPNNSGLDWEPNVKVDAGEDFETTSLSIEEDVVDKSQNCLADKQGQCFMSYSLWDDSLIQFTHNGFHSAAVADFQDVKNDIVYRVPCKLTLNYISLKVVDDLVCDFLSFIVHRKTFEFELCQFLERLRIPFQNCCFFTGKTRYLIVFIPKRSIISRSVFNLLSKIIPETAFVNFNELLIHYSWQQTINFTTTQKIDWYYLKSLSKEY